MSKISQMHDPDICPSEKLLSLAWDTVQAYRSVAFDEAEEFQLLAANDETSQHALLNVRSQSGRWHVVQEEVSGDHSSMFLKFKCLAECVSSYQGRTVVVTLGDQMVELGEVDRHGIAEQKIKQCSPHQYVGVRIRSRG